MNDDGDDDDDDNDDNDANDYDDDDENQRHNAFTMMNTNPNGKNGTKSDGKRRIEKKTEQKIRKKFFRIYSFLLSFSGSAFIPFHSNRDVLSLRGQL